MPGLLRRLFGRTGMKAPAIEATVYPGEETLEVVGESHYQDALWQIVGGFRRDPVRHPIDAVLLPEPNNGHDSNAIRVVVDSHLIGYLSREDARAYRPGLLCLMESCPTSHVALEGHIVGGGPRHDGIGFLGVFLDHNPTDFGIAPQHTSGGSLRTGLSEAIVTDLEDDRYDLSWLRTLDDDNEVASRQLRSLLQGEQDPIDRHFMFSELEARLYRCRDSVASALEEFDAVCRQHHDEIVTLRPALLHKFGVVPVIEMYRQAAIRCQKVKGWEAAREWAQRGIAVYGVDAARPEVVDDLHKRIAHATAKIEAAERPIEAKARPARVAAASSTAGAEIERLSCGSCGASFERGRTKGRKPKICPTCRGLTTLVTPA